MSVSLERAFSKERLTKYRDAFIGPIDPGGPPQGYGVYAWNSRVAAAFMHSVHIFEVVLRNAVCEALESQYGSDWPYSVGFRRSLSSDQEEEVVAIAGEANLALQDRISTGKIIPELSFSFWGKMLHKRFKKRVWERRIFDVFPGLNAKVSVDDHLEMLRDLVEHTRKFRNRIAHHEPIFSRNLVSDRGVLHKLVRLRSDEALQWLSRYDVLNSLFQVKPC